MGKEKKKKELLANMSTQFRSVCRAKNVPPGDFPDMNKFCSVARELDFSEFPKVDGGRLKKGKLMEALDEVLAVEIPHLLEQMPSIQYSGGPTEGKKKHTDDELRELAANSGAGPGASAVAKNVYGW